MHFTCHISSLPYLLWNEFMCTFKWWNIIPFSQDFILIFASQEKPKIVASKTLPAIKDTLLCFMSLWKSTIISTFPCFSPNFLKAEFISCYNCILWTLFLEIKQKWHIHIYSILCKCHPEGCRNRIDISPKKNRWVLLLWNSGAQRRGYTRSEMELLFCKKYHNRSPFTTFSLNHFFIITNLKLNNTPIECFCWPHSPFCLLNSLATP